MYYKVLKNGESMIGKFSWSLPKGDEKGEWHEVDGEISMCQNGLHLTARPVTWFQHKDCEVYEVEIDESKEVITEDFSDKIAVRRCRLVRKLTNDELSKDHDIHIFTSGAHAVTSGKTFALGDAVIDAYDASTVFAYDQSHVHAHEGSLVSTYDQATVSALGAQVIVAANGSSCVFNYSQGSVLRFCDNVKIIQRNPKTDSQLG
jgi:hypothetical protein